MKKYIVSALMVLLAAGTFSSCKKYLDVNSDPDTPQFPDPSSVFPTQLAAIPRGLHFDARYVSRFIQNLNSVNTATAANVNFDRMGYTAASDVNGDIWRQVYFGLGQNLNYIIANGTDNGQWDYVGAAYTLKALMFQYATDYHGEIIFSEAFRTDQAFFKYDDQEDVYRGIDSLCKLALFYLNRTDANPGASKLAKGDYSFNGDVQKWIKLANGVLARNFHRLTNKSIYNADSVIYYADRSMANVNDDFLIPHDAVKNDDANFFGPYRNNLTLFRQSNYIVKLLDGTTLSGSNAAPNRDPRMKHMLTASQDTTNGNGGFRGVDPGTGDPFDGTTTGANARRRVSAVWGDSLYGNPAANNFNNTARRYLFGDKVVMPVMTSAEIQFMKAEAAFIKGDKATALTAYTNGINLHFDFINRTNMPRANNVLFNQNPIPAAERTAYLNGPNVKRDIATLTLSDIMLQKYIALWGWGFFETFVDLRRYHYTDIDPNTGQQVYLGFVLPSPLATENLGKPVYRVRPRYNSEYVWNVEELRRIGALNGDYHTYEPWFVKP